MPTRDPLVKRKRGPENPPKRKHLVLADDDSVVAVCVAMCGQSNDVVRNTGVVARTTGQAPSDGQIGYRLTKAKERMGLPPGEGFRSQWRTGKSWIAQQLLRQVMPMLRREYQEQVVNQIEHKPMQAIATRKFEQSEQRRLLKIAAKQRRAA